MQNLHCSCPAMLGRLWYSERIVQILIFGAEGFFCVGAYTSIIGDLNLQTMKLPTSLWLAFCMCPPLFPKGFVTSQNHNQAGSAASFAVYSRLVLRHHKGILLTCVLCVLCRVLWDYIVQVKASRSFDFVLLPIRATAEKSTVIFAGLSAKLR